MLVADRSVIFNEIFVIQTYLLNSLCNFFFFMLVLGTVFDGPDIFIMHLLNYSTMSVFQHS